MFETTDAYFAGVIILTEEGEASRRVTCILRHHGVGIQRERGPGNQVREVIRVVTSLSSGNDRGAEPRSPCLSSSVECIFYSRLFLLVLIFLLFWFLSRF